MYDLKLLEEHIGETLEDIGIGNDFFWIGSLKHRKQKQNLTNEIASNSTWQRKQSTE